MKAQKTKHPRTTPQAAASVAPHPPASTSTPGPPHWAAKPGDLQAPAFFALYFVCLWKWVDVQLIYHGGGVVRGFPVFFWGWDFARELFRYPGGAVEYFSALLAQSMYVSWLGALLLTAQAWLVLGCFRSFLRGLGAGRVAVVAFVAPLLMLTLYGRYNHASVPITGLAFAAVALWLHQFVRQTSRWLQYSLVLMFSGLLYMMAPAGAALYSFAVAVRGIRIGACRVTALVVLCGLALVPYLEGVWLSGLGVSEAYEKLLPVPWEPKLLSTGDNVTLGILYLMMPVLSLVVVVWQTACKRRIVQTPESPGPSKPVPHPSKTGSKSEVAATEENPEKSPKRVTRLWTIGLETGCSMVFVLVALRAVHRSEVKFTLAADHYAWQRKWPEALAAARSKPSNLFLEATAVQAVFHTGRLTQELPDVKNADDMLLTKEGPLAYWRKSDIYYDIGYVNMALHYLIESVEFWGERPELLKRLATLNLVLGNINTARIYLKSILKVPFHAGWARDRLRGLENDPHSDRDPEVSRLRGLMLRADSVVRLTAEEELLSFLEANPRNRMAYEYLMAHYLLTRNLAGFMSNLPRMREFPGFELSSLWKEAMVVGVSQSRQPIDLKGQALDVDAQRRFDQLLQVVSAAGGNKAEAQAKLKEQYANSYFYYYLYGR